MNLLSIIRWLHILSGAAWLGEVVVINLVLIPALDPMSMEQRRDFMARIFPRVFKLASYVSVLALSSGLAMSYLITGWKDLDLFVSTHRGRWILIGGVLGFALALFHFSGVRWLDPVVSLLICGLILLSVKDVLRDSFNNLMDRELPDEERRRIEEILENEVEGAVGHHDLRTRRSGARRFVDVHVEIDRQLSFLEAHRVAEAAVSAIEAGLPNTRATVHADPWPPDQREGQDRGADGGGG